MAITTFRFMCGFRLLIPVSLTLLCVASNPHHLSAQSQNAQSKPPVIRSSDSQFSTVVLGPISPSPLPLEPQVSKSSAGLTIVPIFDSSIDANTQTVINSAIAFYQNTFTNNITVNIFFYNSASVGLGQSITFLFGVSYSSYCSDLTASASSPDDATALAHTPCGATNPVTGSANILVKSPNGIVVGLNTPEQLFSVGGTGCPNSTAFTGSGCIGLNVSAANSHSISVLSVVEHEIDEVLGLGSALEGTTSPSDPWTEDLFRWASAGTRSFATNPGTSGAACSGSTPAAFFSIDGGNTNLDFFNNCNNGGDYGDWITHTPAQVQDAFVSNNSSPSLSPGFPEVRALDVIGYTIVSSSKHRRGQIISQ